MGLIRTVMQHLPFLSAPSRAPRVQQASRAPRVQPVSRAPRVQPVSRAETAASGLRFAAHRGALVLLLSSSALWSLPLRAETPDLPLVTPRAAAAAEAGPEFGFRPSPDGVLRAPSLNFYGAPGLIDMPSGEAMPDGQIAFGLSTFGGQTRTTLSFQFTPRISGSFRYSVIRDWDSDGFDTYYDRSFDLRFLALEESRYLPSVTIGLQDFAGTGIYAGEYIAATKTFAGGVKGTVGLGWGRLGSANNFGGIFSDDRPAFDPNDTGGEPSVDQWFRGPQSVFAGIEWQPTDRLGLKLEYSTDAYTQEAVDREVFERRSDWNFGLEYQASDQWRLGGYYLYGSELGVMAQFQLNPRRAAVPLRVPAAAPVGLRPDRAANPGLWSQDWIAVPGAQEILRDALEPELAAEGIELQALAASATSIDLRYRNARYLSSANAVGRVARVLARVLPPSIETFQLTPVALGLPTSRITLQRSDLETLEFTPQAGARLFAETEISEAPPLPADAVRSETVSPRFSWQIGPYLEQSFFDPDEPWRYEVGVVAEAAYQFTPNLSLSGAITKEIIGTIADSERDSDSVLPRVRSEANIYAREGDPALENLVLAYTFRPGPDLYGRMTAGYLESMFGGLSGELLWKPVDSRLAFGVELNYARQRDFDQRFGFRDYDVITGHASAYYEFGDGYLGQVDVGQYLAGDKGATFTLSREFDNGWELGGFFTLTDVSAEDFGEGSFDKGILLTIPLGWVLGQPNRSSLSTTIRSLQRDGGQRLEVPGRLYDPIRQDHARALTRQWERVWQ